MGYSISVSIFFKFKRYDSYIFKGVLRLNQVCNKNVMRWSLAAHDICFVEKRHSLLFVHGKCIPVVRGAGVYQPAVDMCIDKLKLGDWVHIFPEGKVNMTKEVIR
jgi:monolysocardiolipin acyltransferase